MRTFLVLAGLLVLSAGVAKGDESVSGQWRADQGHGVLISMDILADGHWFSETIQNNKVVAEMAGTYEQTKTDDANGKLVFTPLKSKTSADRGAAIVEEDRYTLGSGGKMLKLTTGNNEVMEFRNFTQETVHK